MDEVGGWVGVIGDCLEGKEDGVGVMGGLFGRGKREMVSGANRLDFLRRMTVAINQPFLDDISGDRLSISRIDVVRGNRCPG